MVDELRGPLKLVPGRRGGRYPHCNSLLIDSGPRAIIDPGSNRNALRELAGQGVGLAILSHYHSDHLRDLKELAGAAVWVHASEKEAIESWEGMARLVWFPDEVKDPTWQKRKLKEVGGWGWPVAGTFVDEQEMMVGDARVVVIHTPGHTPGHCCFWFPDHKILYSADIDLTEFGPWYGNAASDVDAFRGSIRRVSELHPEITVTGHETGVVSGDITPQLRAYAAIIERRHSMILEFLSSPRTLSEIVSRAFIYGPYYSPTNSYHAQEFRMVRHHLASALRHRQVSISNNRYERL
ncbi:MAG TPA: MBL fold metallo-hydrolase [bacterium]|nr:MBL fold metallo-hydrolase [bacterium]